VIRSRLSEAELRDLRDQWNLQPIDTPPILYKYRNFDSKGHYLKLIQDSELWFSSAREFNDPFDSALQYQYEDNPPGIRRKWAEDFLKRDEPHLNSKEREEVIDKRLQEIDKDVGYIERLQQHNVELNYKKYGICSLTMIRDDLLMWAHYSDHHRGFCVGIDTEELLNVQISLAKYKKQLVELIKVIYSYTMPSVNFFDSMLSQRDNDIVTLLTTKSEHWSYERECRLTYYDHIDTPIHIGHSAIVEVIMGCKIDDKNKQDMLSLLDKKSSRTAVFQASKHKSDFALEFEKIR
jgi:hypothetical protein